MPARGKQPYPVMSTDEIAALPIGDLCEPDAVLFLWMTWPTLQDAMWVITRWGFTYKTCAFCWTKASNRQLDMFQDDLEGTIGTGYWTRSNSEACLWRPGSSQALRRKCYWRDHRPAVSIPVTRGRTQSHRSAGRRAIPGAVRATTSPGVGRLGQRNGYEIREIRCRSLSTTVPPARSWASKSGAPLDTACSC